MRVAILDCPKYESTLYRSSLKFLSRSIWVLWCFLLLKMPACVAFGCTSRPDKKIPGISFHKFPANAEMREAWIMACRRKNWLPSKWSSLCSLHFTEEQIDRTSLSSVRLRDNAVPNVFPSFPPNLQNVCELHFKETDFLTETSAFDSKTGRTISAPLYIRRLKNGVVPSLNISSNVPPKSVSSSSRETPEQKRLRFENEQLSLALKQSLRSTSGENSLTEDMAETSSHSRSIEKKVTNSVKKRGTKRKNIPDDDDVRNINGLNVRTPSLQYSLAESITSSDLGNNSTLPLENVEIKEETQWEKDYNYIINTSSNSDTVKITSVESCVNNQNENVCSEQVASSIKSASSVQNKDAVPSSKDAKSKAVGWDTTFYKKPLKIDKRDDSFGKFVACEMSDLRTNPELYLKTQQSILKILVEAHFEQMCPNNVV